MSTKAEVLGVLNALVREEHGTPVKETSFLKDSGIDSFGFTMVLLELDAKYGCFDKEWFKEHVNAELTVETILARIEDTCK